MLANAHQKSGGSAWYDCSVQAWGWSDENRWPVHVCLTTVAGVRSTTRDNTAFSSVRQAHGHEGGDYCWAASHDGASNIATAPPTLLLPPSCHSWNQHQVLLLRHVWISCVHHLVIQMRPYLEVCWSLGKALVWSALCCCNMVDWHADKDASHFLHPVVALHFSMILYHGLHLEYKQENVKSVLVFPEW